ncbi:chymotrypsin inhibitor Ani s 6-like [Diprion similis]|uniref:chymotrypsin inhibitor Ani s 6-like n=1 Tax=Diprion similis TaxID=362088 RepID=UPI001EF944BC|nr:chymotrypsin inhibitor Ani s 6-like [Diprion similis]
MIRKPSVFFIIFLLDVVTSASLRRGIISTHQTLPYCGPNTIRTECGNPCQFTCGQLKPKYCPRVCIPDGCVCKPGYVRRDENGPCIPESWCTVVAEKWNWIQRPRPRPRGEMAGPKNTWKH